MSYPSSIQSDMDSIVALTSQDSFGEGVAPELRYRERNLKYLQPTNPGLNQTILKFNTTNIANEWTDLSQAFLSLPLSIRVSGNPLVPAPQWPALAFKSSALSAINRVVVRTTDGTLLLDEQNSGVFANHLRICFEKDQGWLQLVAPGIHYARDKCPDGVVGLYQNSSLESPSIAKYIPGSASFGVLSQTVANLLMAYIAAPAPAALTSYNTASPFALTSAAAALLVIYMTAQAALVASSTPATILAAATALTAYNSSPSAPTLSAIAGANLQLYYTAQVAYSSAVGAAIPPALLVAQTALATYNASAFASIYPQVNGDNPSYNSGFHERSIDLMKSTITSSGGTTAGTSLTAGPVNVTLNLPLSCLCDFFKQLKFPIIGTRLEFEFWLTTASATPFIPLTIGSSTYSAGAATPDTTGTVSIAINDSDSNGSRLYYHNVVLQPSVNSAMQQRLSSGFHKEISWKRYDLIQLTEIQNLANQTPKQVWVTQAANAPRRLWALCYPTATVNTQAHPSVLVTGANGLTNVQVIVAGKNLYSNPLMTQAEMYAELKQAMMIGGDGDPESLLPYDSFRLTSRIMCFDLSRVAYQATDPNAPLSIQMQLTTETQAPVDIILLLESEMKAKLGFGGSNTRVSVGPARVQ